MKRLSYAVHKGEKAKVNRIPKHVAIIMDGNGRWAQKKHLPRSSGHRKGRETVRDIVRTCVSRGVEVLTLFAFGKENWKRPEKEVRTLFRLLFLALNKEIDDLKKQGVNLNIIGDLHELPDAIQKAAIKAHASTEHNEKLILNILVNYSGRWDILNALKSVVRNEAADDGNCDKLFEKALSLSRFPEPELFIRTAGVQRLSNFILWDLAYTELYFTPVYWPDFNETEFDKALAFYADKERRFGLTSEQVESISLPSEA